MSTNIVNLLKPISWRGVTAPCSVIATNFGNRQAIREYPYVDVEGHDNTGRKGKRCKVSLHFLNSIEDGLYPTKWGTWRNFLDDGSAGPLYHPDLGKIQARVFDGDYVITAQSASGISVNVEFGETRVKTDTPITYVVPPADAKAAASQADAAMQALGIDYPDGTGDPSLSESLAALATLIDLTPQLIVGKINSIEGTINDLQDRFDAIGSDAANLPQPLKDSLANDPARWVLLASLQLVFDALEAQRTQLQANARPTAQTLTAHDQSMSALSQSLSNELIDLLTLNPAFASIPLVPSGSTITYYKGS